MLDRDYRDIVAGLVISTMGGAAALYALATYATGTLTRMGPGMMPATLGTILVVFGLLIAIPALARRGKTVHVRVRPLIFLSASVLSFAVMIRSVGFVPTVFATTFIATFAESNLSLTRAAVLAGAMALLTWSIFILGLGLTIPAFDWRF
ncbi:tripartite tricarboxylate transporter TctB family protein [Roseinatronobacter alkalisoli]|uniref:Tripartite tricarboxylate transporter TctB family protein n=1 Tax=Roseinatronobacter alkalisoli TaxID=3028235 RepID=A0ABT5TDB7_9RHOB|nr:tripartite tricarboxylate transporter TctB family protein [Roseinatronobacter sp. HJB301]MDD7973123.1 tripartite tricarboxylate transporter TctB family protein [Roseinatronobacter sp. HJB301]